MQDFKEFLWLRRFIIKFISLGLVEINDLPSLTLLSNSLLCQLILVGIENFLTLFPSIGVIIWGHHGLEYFTSTLLGDKQGERNILIS